MIYLTDNVGFESSLEMSILDSALNHGLVLEYSCKHGICGVCKVKVLTGETKLEGIENSLSKKELRNGYILACCRSAIGDVYLEAENLSVLKEIEIKTLPARIASIQNLSNDIVEVYLRIPPSVEFKFVEGQYIDVLGLNSVRRSYSIASNSEDIQIKLLIKKVEGGIFSHYWFEKAQKNDLLRLEGPKGTFFLRDSSVQLIFLATGTGIAPIISILEGLDIDSLFVQTSSIHVFWGNKKPEDFIWKPRFQKLKLDIHYVLSEPHLEWKGRVGYVQDFVRAKVNDLINVDVYACGSHKMIEMAKSTLLKQGLKKNHFFSDAFVQSY